MSPKAKFDPAFLTDEGEMVLPRSSFSERRSRGPSIALALSLTFSAAAHAQDLTIRPSGDIQTIYQWETDKCSDEHIPDAPARAFRRADGKVVMIATHRENWSLVGDVITNLDTSCKTIMSSLEHDEQKLGNLWIEATYTNDGTNIAALVSEDLTTRMRQRGCIEEALPGRCWVNNILHAKSADAGETFQLSPINRRTVATLGSSYPDGMEGRLGVFTTTNIVKKGDFFYMLAWAQGQGRQPAGNCLFRSADPFDPSGWRAWDGKTFAVNLSQPVSANSCRPVAGITNEARSISYIPERDEWVTVYASRKTLTGDRKPVPGFYFSTSRNLTDWVNPRRIMPAPTVAREFQLDYTYAYPSLFDPQSKTRNFETIDGRTAILTFARHNLSDGRGTMSRDLVFVPVKLTW